MGIYVSLFSLFAVHLVEHGISDACLVAHIVQVLVVVDISECIILLLQYDRSGVVLEHWQAR